MPLVMAVVANDWKRPYGLDDDCRCPALDYRPYLILLRQRSPHLGPLQYDRLGCALPGNGFSVFIQKQINLFCIF